MPQLFDTLEIPDFTDTTAEEGFAACVAWADWAYDVADDFSDDKWDEVVCIMGANYDRYHKHFEE